MVYITLGAPQQKHIYQNTKYLQPMEIWFYQDPGSALAPYFSVIFFKPERSRGIQDLLAISGRPEKLIASTNAVNDPPTALKIIKNRLGQ